MEIEQTSDGVYKVTLEQEGTEHTVELSKDYFEKLTSGNASEEELIEESFDFLLEREPASSILPRFDLPTISRYFPEYEGEMARRFER
jgi:hypothetical protein